MTEFNSGCSEAVFWHRVTPGWLARRGEEERVPHSPSAVIGMLEHCSVTTERREQGEAVVRIETGHVPPDETRMGVGWEGWGRSASAR